MTSISDLYRAYSSRDFDTFFMLVLCSSRCAAPIYHRPASNFAANVSTREIERIRVRKNKKIL